MKEHLFIINSMWNTLGIEEERKEHQKALQGLKLTKSNLPCFKNTKCSFSGRGHRSR